MTKLLNLDLIKKGKEYLKLKKYNKAIRLFYIIIKNNPRYKIKMGSYLGLGDALRAEYEVELAEKMYKKALDMAEIIEDTCKIKLIEDKIKNIYVFKHQRELNPFQIGFFMRGIMKILSFLGKTDWF